MLLQKTVMLLKSRISEAWIQNWTTNIHNQFKIMVFIWGRDNLLSGVSARTTVPRTIKISSCTLSVVSVSLQNAGVGGKHFNPFHIEGLLPGPVFAAIGFYNFPLQINITNLYFLLVWGEKHKWQIDIQSWMSQQRQGEYSRGWDFSNFVLACEQPIQCPLPPCLIFMESPPARVLSSYSILKSFYITSLQCLLCIAACWLLPSPGGDPHKES